MLEVFLSYCFRLTDRLTVTHRALTSTELIFSVLLKTPKQIRGGGKRVFVSRSKLSEVQDLLTKSVFHRVTGSKNPKLNNGSS